jgi:hypothetical protein
MTVRNQTDSLPRQAVVAIVVLACLTGYAEPPAWWTERNVLKPGGAVEDFAPVNQGQVKHIATQACAQMDSELPGGAGTGVHAVVAGFSVSNNHYAANIGQLKSLARPFYARLIGIGYTNAYPWTSDSYDDVDYAVVNIGQLKNLFDFRGLAPWEAALPYASSFETTEGYAEGDLNRQNGWATSGQGVRVQTNVAQGSASIALEGWRPGAQRHCFSTNRVITNSLSLYIREVGRFPTNLQHFPFQASSLVSFDPQRGFVALNGNGQGGGSWTAVPNSLVTQQWVNVVIVQDFVSNKWSMAINSTNKADKLGFKDNGSTSVHGLHLEGCAVGTVYLDNVAIDGR